MLQNIPKNTVKHSSSKSPISPEDMKYAESILSFRGAALITRDMSLELSKVHGAAISSGHIFVYCFII